MEEKGQKIIVDANILVGAHYFYDALHYKTTKVLEKLHKYKPQYYTNNYIIAETLTVLLVRSGNLKITRLFGESVYKESEVWFKILQIDEKLQKSSFEILKNQNIKHGLLSFQDCTLIAQARREKIKTILTFDKTLKQFEKEGFKVLP